ncbi:hypothetical protein [Fimbriimonas ginsengisoli]|uniref:Uncharacterized protein n=1 Tax=Fimbriimonas ginsengisoli Gsoil 348 TaxID=661478 RepID=A0A068NM25_FIMGI|nr:hypothetical protein [Fimbriimonas ginsengisoli]AIE84521.1 hypothetical protein OP10G_1153 [Fimbriimonas ginsengisoli Gsoil 348]
MISFAAGLILALGIGIPGPPQVASKFPLAAFVGKDFKALTRDELEPMRRFLVSKRIGSDSDPRLDVANRLGGRYDPWALWDWGGDGSKFVLAIAQYGKVIPSQSRGGVFIFDSAGNVVGSSTFGVGWRTFPTSIETQEVAGVGKVIHFSSRPVINGREDVAGFFVGMDGSRPALIRIADKKDRVVPNVYFASNHQLGPAFDTADVIDKLKSDSPIRVLEALNWFAGMHALPDPQGWMSSGEKISDAVRYRTLAGLPETFALIFSLTHSANPWIRDAARLALEHRGWPYR